MRTPGKFPSALLLCGVAAMHPARPWAQPAGVDGHKLTIKSYLDFGHLVNGSNPDYVTAGGTTPNLSMLPLNRANVIAIQDVSIKRFDVSVGLAALVWWPYGGGNTDAKQRVMTVKPLIPVARARWQFGAPTSVAGSLQLGTFNYKYNTDAKNLGEYLYRAGTYPGFLWSSEGWLLMNRAGNYSHGLLLSLSHFGGALKHNFSLFMETQYFPIGDFSPGYDFSFTSKWVEIGGGAVLNHFLASRPSLLTPKSSQNTYIHAHVSQMDTAGVLDTVDYRGPMDLALSVGTMVDTVETQHWTFRGIKVMGRAALNLGHLLPEAMRGPEDLRLFAEAAVLGLENQPLYYEKMNERTPIMAGITLPTAKLLDAFTVQVEYYKSPYNNIRQFNENSLPIWDTEFSTDSTGFVLLTDARGQLIPRAIHKDDFKWSITAKKSFNKVMTLNAQVASDHLRLMNGDFRASPVPLVSSSKEWYYLFRLEFTLR